MTKKEQQKLQQLFNTINKTREQENNAFKQLQDLNASLGNPRWCSALNNYNDIVKTTTDTRILLRAETALANYYEASGKQYALIDLGDILYSLNFWDKK